MSVIFKINYKDDIRRISLDRAPSYEELKQIVKQLFNIGSLFQLKYEDEEKDQITIASEGELNEALNVSSKYFSGILRIFVFDKSPSTNAAATQEVPQPNPFASVFSHALSGGSQDVASLVSKLQEVGLSQPSQQQSLQTLNQLMTTFPWLNDTMTAVIKQGLFPPPSFATTTTTASTNTAVSNVNQATSPMVPSKPAKTRYLAKFIKDLSIMDGTVFGPNIKFTKTWRVRNDSATAWPEKTTLIHVGGDRLAPTNMVQVPLTEAGQEVDISVEMTSPSLPGRYNSFWRLCGPDGNKFGHRMWVDITVKTSLEEPIAKSASPVVAPVPQPPSPVVAPSSPVATQPAVLAPSSPVQQQQPELEPVVQQPVSVAPLELEPSVNDKVEQAPASNNGSTTPAEAAALGTLVDMGFVGDLLSVLRKHGGDLMGTLSELVGNN